MKLERSPKDRIRELLLDIIIEEVDKGKLLTKRQLGLALLARVSSHMKDPQDQTKLLLGRRVGDPKSSMFQDLVYHIKI